MSESENKPLGRPPKFATSEELEPYVALLEEIGRAARDAFEKGIPASEAAAEYTLPASLGEWTMFSTLPAIVWVRRRSKVLW